MENKLFEDIYSANGKEKMEEIGILGVAAGVILGLIGVPIAVGIVKGVLGAVAVGAGALSGSIVAAGLKKSAKGVDKFLHSDEVAAMIADHKDDFEGLSAKATAILLDKLLQQNFPEDYKKLAELARDTNHKRRDFVSAVVGTEGKPSASDPEKLAALKDKYGIKSFA